MLIDHIPPGVILFFIFYGVTGVVPLIAAFYLLLRRGNAIAPGVTSPLRLRRWTAAFFAVSTLAHVWWLLFYIYSSDLQSVSYMVLAMADCVLLFTTFAGMLLAMLQDRCRPVWPALVAVIPFVALAVVYMVNPSSLLEQFAAGYLVLLGLLFTGYMVFAIRQYGRWLNDNYADLENKKVWLSQTVSLVCMLLFVLYVLATNMVHIWFIHVFEFVLVVLLLWRVETLPQLDSISTEEETEETSVAPAPETEAEVIPTQVQITSSNLANIDLAQIEQLLTEHCATTRLYLQHDLSLQQLARTVGTNRSYLSQYFSRQGITYNTYINNLRINYFISRYQEVASTQQPFTVKQLVSESGYHSYSTFSLAFKQRMGQSVTDWMHDAG